MTGNIVHNNQTAALPDALQQDVRRIQSLPTIKTILEVVCRTTEMGFAVVARVTDRHWVACATKDNIGFGLKPGDELRLETTICQSIRQMGSPVMIDNVEKDPFYCTHQTPKFYSFQSYISVPIFRKGGELFGTLCAIDPEPRKVDCPEIREMFSLFAEIIAQHLDAADQNNSVERKPGHSLEPGILTDQFIAVLGHDLRNPVRAIADGAESLQRMELDADARHLSEVIRNSAFRISELIENVLDFDRGRFGNNLNVSCRMVDHPGIYFSQVINEWQAAWPGREIKSFFNLSFPFFCDITRISHLLSNLLGNALCYGTQDTPVEVRAENRGTQFFLSITNSGPAITKEAMGTLFQPFSQGELKPGRRGPGLGLYIANQIAKAHGGGIYVESTDLFTRFTFFMPVLPPDRLQ